MKKLISILSIVAIATLVGCSNNSSESDKVIKVGATASPHAVILEFIKPQLEKEGYTLDITVIDDYNIPNKSVEEGTLDANYFQHLPFLDSFNKDNGTDLVSAGSVHFEPLGIYSNDTTKENATFGVADVQEGAIIAVPDDASNEARALLLLEAKGIITLKDGVGLEATKLDIVTNPKNVEIKEVKANGIPAILPDVAYAVVNGNYALSNKIDSKFIVGEGLDSTAAKTYANIVAVQKANLDSDKTKALMKALKSDETKAYIKKEFGNLVIATE